MRRHSRTGCLLALILQGVAPPMAPPLRAQEPPLELTRLSGPVVLDGRIDEPAWDDVPLLPVTQFAPVFQGEPTERTEMMVAYDDAYLYVAGRMYDSDPNGVRSVTLERDQYQGDDLFSIVLDTYNDYESAVWFTASPSGVRSDRTISNDGEFTTGRAMNDSWNSHWDLATTWTDEGWFAEMRIPFSTLGFQSRDGRVEMGMIVYRYIARKNERLTYPEIPPDWGMGFAKPSQARRIILEGVYAEKPLYLTPYALGGVERSAELNQAETRYETASDPTTEAGLDVKYNLTDNLTLDVTVNPDFGQVEADSLQVNLTRFSLFFPEKRQFFQERAGLFDFNTGGVSRLFHSRQIGLDPGGDPVRIYGGVRVVGRVGGTDVGLLNMQTASKELLPSENFGVVRLRRQVLNPYSTVGAMATTRVSTEGGEFGVSAGLDTSLRLFGDEYLTAKWIATFVDEDPAAPARSFLDGSRVLLRWERRNQTGLSYAADYVRSGSAYEPRMGFVVRSDFTRFGSNLQYRWFQPRASALRTTTLGTVAELYRRNTEGTVESASIRPALELELKNGQRAELALQSLYESVTDTFPLSGAVPVLPGDYWFHQAEASYTLSRTTLLRGGLNARAGTFYDGWRVGVGGGPSMSFSRHLEVGLGYELNVVRFPDRDEALDAHLFSVKTQAALDTHLSTAVLVQYDSTQRRVSAQARVRYHFREGSDLWLVYNDLVNTERDVLGGPRLPLSQSRSLMLKYTYTFVR